MLCNFEPKLIILIPGDSEAPTPTKEGESTDDRPTPTKDGEQAGAEGGDLTLPDLGNKNQSQQNVSIRQTTGEGHGITGETRRTQGLSGGLKRQPTVECTKKMVKLRERLLHMKNTVLADVQIHYKFIRLTRPTVKH